MPAPASIAGHLRRRGGDRRRNHRDRIKRRSRHGPQITSRPPAVPRSRLPADATAAAASSRLRKARTGLRDVLGGGRFTCSCCPDKVFRGHKALNAHHLARHGNYWGGKAGKAMARKVGKDYDRARRHARGWLEAHGHVDRMGRRTGRAQSRPELRGTVRIRDLRAARRHGRDHDKADGAVRKHTARAGRHDARGNEVRADISRGRAADATHRLRTAWPVRPRPVRVPDPGRPVPASSNGNGARPAPARTPRQGRTRA